MNDERKSKAELILELKTLRRQVKRYQAIAHRAERTEEALRESEAKYRLLVENSIDAVLLTSPDGGIQDANKAACRMFGRTVRELRQLGRRAVVDLSDPRLAQAIEGRKRLGKFKGELTLLRKDGSKFPGEISSVVFKDKDGNLRTSMSIRDITERKRAEAVPIESERKLKTLFEILPVGTSILDAERNIVYVNSALERILDVSTKGLLKGDYRTRTYLRPDGTLMPAEEFASVRAIKKQRAVYNVETGVVKQDGEVIWTSVSAVPVAFPDWKVVVVTSDITERKVAEEALRESEERLRRLYQQAPLGYQSLNAEGCFIDVNRAWLDLLGYSRDEVIGRWFGDFLAPQEVDVFKQRFPRFKATGEVHVDLEMIQRAASTIIVHIDGKIGHDEHGQFKQTHCILYDITERKRAEDALRESEERHRSLVEAVPDVIYTISAEDGSLTSLNPAFETVTGWSRAEWIGKPFASLVHPDDLPLAEQTFQRALRGETQPSYELRVLSKSGECLVGEFTSTPHVKDGKVVGEFGIARDITERKKVEQVLQQERILLRTLIDNLPDAIYVKDMASRKTVANLADVHNTGRQSEAEVLGKDDFELFPKDLAERFFADDQSVIQTGQPILEREEYVLDAEGQKRWLLTSKLPLRDEKGQVVGLVGIGRDITSRKRAEEILKESEKKYRILFEEMPVGIAISTIEGKIIEINNAQAEMIGYTVEELAGRSVNEYYIDPDKRREMIDAFTKNRKVRLTASARTGVVMASLIG